MLVKDLHESICRWIDHMNTKEDLSLTIVDHYTLTPNNNIDRTGCKIYVDSQYDEHGSYPIIHMMYHECHPLNSRGITYKRNFDIFLFNNHDLSIMESETAPFRCVHLADSEKDVSDTSYVEAFNRWIYSFPFIKLFEIMYEKCTAVANGKYSKENDEHITYKDWSGRSFNRNGDCIKCPDYIRYPKANDDADEMHEVWQSYFKKEAQKTADVERK